jgi:hypothetical protein
MKRRNSLIIVVLAMLLLFASSFSFKGNTAQAFGCTQFCANGYNACMIECNGDPNCQHGCWVDWECCKFMCDGTGTCW